MQILPTVIATTTTTAMPVRSPPSPDLFDSMTLPPQFETETEMQLRIQREAEEKRRNDQIDEEVCEALLWPGPLIRSDALN